MAIGRISGPLLKANLVRDGVDLAFETDLLYLDVTNARIGVNKSSPASDFDVNGTLSSNNLAIDSTLTVSTFTLTGNSITSSNNIINFQAAAGEATVYHSRLLVDDFQLQGNTISTTSDNKNINIEPNGSGTVEITSDTNVYGDLYVSGNITADGDVIVGGNVTIGNEPSDTLTVNAKINSDLIPETNNTYDLGAAGATWANVYTNNFFVTSTLGAADFVFSGSTISTTASTVIFGTGSGEGVQFNSKLLIDDIEIQGNNISTVNSNASLEFGTSGTGTIELLANTNITGNLYVSGNVEAVGNVTIGGNIVIGDESTDTVTINARITSSLLPELDNTYDLGSPATRWKDIYVNNLNADSLTLSTLNIGNLIFQDNNITSTTNADIIIDGNGTGGVQLGNFRISDNTITNTLADAISVVQQTSTGYFKIATTNGFVPPVGTTDQRPTAYAVVGMTRYNTTTQVLEIWNGVAWGSPAGSGGEVTIAQAEEIAAGLAIALG